VISCGSPLVLVVVLVLDSFESISGILGQARPDSILSSRPFCRLFVARP
jgi:hypothetical protein